MLYAIVFFAVVIVDQLTKALIEMNNVHVMVIKDVFSIDITRNPGAAFSMLGDKPWGQTFFIVLTVIALIAVVVFFILEKKNSKWLNLSITFLASGAVGNFIDRLAFKEVRDFIYVHFFANFNVADIAVTVGGIMFVVYFLFIDKEAIFKGNKGNKNDK